MRAEKFADVQNAYEVLTDDDKRQAYDRFGHAGVDASMGGGGDASGFSSAEEFMAAREIFEQMFGNMSGGRRRRCVRCAVYVRAARMPCATRV